MDNIIVNNASVEERQQKDKEVLIETLKEMPIIQVACKRAGISRATYYRWRSEDKNFRRTSEDAMEQGYAFINDMSESQVITLIKEKKMPAITLWLKHHHARYGAKSQSYTSLSSSAELSPDEERMLLEALALTSGKPVGNTKHHHDINHA